MHRSKTKRLNYCFLLLLFLTGNKKELEEEAKRLVKEDQEENITSSAPERKKKKITTNRETTKKTLEQEIASAMHLINSDLQDGITSTQDGSTSTDTKPLPSLLLSQERSSNQQFPSPQQENTFMETSPSLCNNLIFVCSHSRHSRHIVVSNRSSSNLSILSISPNNVSFVRMTPTASYAI